MFGNSSNEFLEHLFMKIDANSDGAIDMLSHATDMYSITHDSDTSRVHGTVHHCNLAVLILIDSNTVQCREHCDAVHCVMLGPRCSLMVSSVACAGNVSYHEFLDFMLLAQNGATRMENEASQNKARCIPMHRPHAQGRVGI